MIQEVKLEALPDPVKGLQCLYWSAFTCLIMGAFLGHVIRCSLWFNRHSTDMSLIFSSRDIDMSSSKGVAVKTKVVAVKGEGSNTM
eukprot:993118-Karenia_brevis.AAC.1